jgi:hypothetical protein
MMAPADVIRETWPEHTSCLDLGEPHVYEDEGIVCPCGYILGWPPDDNPDETAAGDVPADVQRDEFDRHAADDPDGYLFDRQGPIPDDWAAQAAEDAAIAEQAGGGNPEGPPWDMPSGDGPEKLDTIGGARQDNQLHPVVPSEAAQPGTAVAGVPHSEVTPEDPISARLAAIDPTMPYTPTDIELQLVDIERRLESGQLFQRVWEQRAFDTAKAYKIAWAKAMNASNGGSADKREAEVFIATQAEWIAKAEAEYMVKAVRDTMHNLRSMLTGFQSIARSVAASMSVAGTDIRRDQARR